MTSVYPVRFRSVHRPAQQWLAVAWVELLLRLRDTNVPILAACVAATCILLTPSADASYAVITFGSMKPVMSAGSALVSAGLVLSLLMLPVYTLGLGLGCVRDRKLRTGELVAASPVDPVGISGGRMAANLFVVLAFSLLTLCLVTVALVSRLGSLPGITSMASYLLIVVPAGVFGLPLAALLDRYFGGRQAAKSFAAILLWTALMVTSLLAWPDAFGFAFLRQNAPAGAGVDFSVGIVSAGQLSRVPWTTVQLSSAFAASRFGMLALLLSVCAAVCLMVRTGLLRHLGRALQFGAAASPGVAVAVPHLPRLRPSHAGPLAAACTVMGRWLKANRTLKLVLAATVACAFLAPSPRTTLALALLIPLAIVNARRISGQLEVRLFEQTNAALRRPSPLIFTALLLAALTAIPAAPALTHLPLLRILHVLVAISAASLWLVWSCAGNARPLLGISIYALAWYIECFSDLPPAADLLGLGATSPVSCAAAAALASALAFLTLRKDSYGYRSTHHG